jgi:hypothetical protein
MSALQMQAQKMQVRPALLHSHVFSWAAFFFTKIVFDDEGWNLIPSRQTQCLLFPVIN